MAFVIVCHGRRAMQHPLPSIRRNRNGLTTVGATVLAALVGCGGPAAPPPPPKPHAGVALTLSCPDPAVADAIDPVVRSWAGRTGAAVTVSRAPADPTDLAVIPAADLGAWAEGGKLAPVPARLRAADHPFRWADLLPAYADRLVGWGGEAFAVPLTGDGVVLAYRADRFADPAATADFAKKHGRPLAPPATWEQFAEVAAFFAGRDGSASLPPLPADPGRRLDLFARVASSFARPALSDKDLDARNADPELLAFQFELRTGKPRVNSSGFRLAAEWFAGLAAAKALPPGGPDDPAAALADGRAVLAVLSLDQLARLPRERTGAGWGALRTAVSGAPPREGVAVSARFGVANVPGAGRHFDPARNAVIAGPTTNYVPHFAGGRLGVVRATCAHPDLAFDLLAEIGGPARGAELIATPGLGAGPTRTTHLTPDRLALWLGYGFDDARSRALQDALRHYLSEEVKNPTFGLRGPDRAALTAAAAGPLGKLGTGANPADVLAELNAAWLAHDAKAGDPGALVRWRRRAVGLN